MGVGFGRGMGGGVGVGDGASEMRKLQWLSFKNFRHVSHYKRWSLDRKRVSTRHYLGSSCNISDSGRSFFFIVVFVMDKI